MYNQFHFTKFIEGLINSLNKKNNNVLFFKQYSDISGVEKEIYKKFKDLNNVEILYFQYDNSELQEAFEPFLGWIKTLYNIYFSDKYTPEKFIEKCNVYGAHKKIFVSYLKNGMAVREHEIIINEVNYEMHRIRGGIINIFDFISKHVNLVLIMNRFHFANVSTCEFVLDFLKYESFNRIALMCIYDDSYRRNINVEEIWKKLSIYIEDNNFLMSLDNRTIGEGTTIIKKEFTPKVSNIEYYITKLNNMLSFLAYKQASMYIDIIFNKVSMENLNLTSYQIYQLTLIGIWSKICTGDTNEAIYYCSTLSDNYNLHDEVDKDFEYNYLSTLAYVYSSKTKEATKHASRCMELAKSTGNNNYFLRSHVARCYVDFYGWKYVLGELDTDFPLEIIKVFEQKGMLSLVGNVYAYAYKNDPGYDVEKAKIKLVAPKFIEKAIDIAKKTDNEFLLATAYMNKANICASVNNYDYVDSIYRECIKIYKKYDENILMAQIYISVGYNLLMVDEYEHSNQYFNDALEILYLEKDIERIGETLYNMGINCMLALDYNNALEFLITSKKICQILELNGYAVCKLSKIYGLIAICSYYINDEFVLNYYVNKAENMLVDFLQDNEVDETYWEEDLFLYYFSKGLLCLKENNYDEALRLFFIAKEYADKCVYFNFFSYPLLAVEIAKIYYKMDKNQEADDIIDTTIVVMDKYNFIEKKKLLLGCKSGIVFSCQKKLGLINISIKKIIDTAYYKKEINQYHSENKDINFLFSWQNILNQFDKKTYDFYEKNLISIKNSFSLDGIYCFVVKDNVVENIFTNADLYIAKDKYSVIAKAVKDKVPAFIVNNTEAYIEEQKDLIECFDNNGIFTVLGIPYISVNNVNYYLLGYADVNSNFANNKILFNSKVLQVIKIIFGQFVDAIWRIESNEEIRLANDKLEDMATKDILTGLYNRQGYVSKVKELYKKGVNKSVLMYFDLDNFKYYNDTFGHDMGDAILTEFAIIIQKCQKEGDFAVRYGGDEFLLILEGKDVEYSKMIADQIYDMLDNEMTKCIKDKNSKKSNVNYEKKLTCSIGISIIDFSSREGIDNSMRQADKALYEVKRSGKGKYRIVD